MKKTFISVSIIIALVMSLMVPAYAANKYNYKAATGVAVIDGVEDKIWSSVAWEEMKTNSDTEIEPFSAKFKVMYSKDTLYVLAKVMDASPDVSAADPWNQDSVEFYFDETNGKKTTYDENVRHININRNGVVTDYITATPEKLVRKSAVQSIDGGYIVEVAIAIEKVELTTGTEIGFEMSANNGKGGRLLNYLRWNAAVEEEAYLDASVFGTVTCLAADTGSKPPQTAAVTAAKPIASSVVVNGKQINFEAYAIKDSNYFKLRDLAMVVNGTTKSFSIGLDSARNAIELTTGKAYSPVGGELTGSDKPAVKQATVTTSTLYVNGKEVSVTAYNIGGSNYFKLRDIAAAIDFAVTWDANLNKVGINTEKGYTK